MSKFRPLRCWVKPCERWPKWVGMSSGQVVFLCDDHLPNTAHKEKD